MKISIKSVIWLVPSTHSILLPILLTFQRSTAASGVQGKFIRPFGVTSAKTKLKKKNFDTKNQ